MFWCRDKPPAISNGEKQAALYNLACCYSRQGNLENGLRALASAPAIQHSSDAWILSISTFSCTEHAGHMAQWPSPCTRVSMVLLQQHCSTAAPLHMSQTC